jgi:hypothetical protein
VIDTYRMNSRRNLLSGHPTVTEDAIPFIFPPEWVLFDHTDRASDRL